MRRAACDGETGRAEAQSGHGSRIAAENDIGHGAVDTACGGVDRRDHASGDAGRCGAVVDQCATAADAGASDRDDFIDVLLTIQIEDCTRRDAGGSGGVSELPSAAAERIRVAERERACGDRGGAAMRVIACERPSACALLVHAIERIHAAAVADDAGDDSRACAVEQQISAGGDGCDGTAQSERAGIGEDFGVAAAASEIDGAEEGVVACFIDDGPGGAAGVVADGRG